MPRFLVALILFFVSALVAGPAVTPGQPAGPSLGPELSTAEVRPLVYLPIAGKMEESGRHTYYVAMDGSDDDLGTEAQPFRTIRRGISLLAPGDVLYIKEGVYDEAIRDVPSGTSWNVPVTIQAYPGASVVIKPAWDYVVYLSQSQYVILNGLVLDGSNSRKDAVLIDEGAHHIRLENSEVKNSPRSGVLVADYGPVPSDYNEFIGLNIHNNGQTDFDHGMYIMTSHNLIDHSSIHDNSGWGVHIYTGKCPGQCADANVVRNNMIYNNARAGARGAGIILSSGKDNMAYNNVVAGNERGIQVAYGVSGVHVYNNVLYANKWVGVEINSDSVGAIVRNNIVYLNGGPPIADAGSGTIQDHNYEQDPRFVNPASRDFHLDPSSPIIDAGVALAQVPDDMDGVRRPQGAGYDIGAYESRLSTQITDFQITQAQSDTHGIFVWLQWTIPAGAVAYAMRSSPRPITDANWESATSIPVSIPTFDYGNLQLLTMSVENSGSTFYLALRSQNSLGQWSAVSNNAVWPTTAFLPAGSSPPGFPAQPTHASGAEAILQSPAGIAIIIVIGLILAGWAGRRAWSREHE